jgi:hypothetical protein
VQNYIKSLQGAGAGDAARDVTSAVLAHNPNATAADKALVAKYNPGNYNQPDLSNANGVASSIDWREDQQGGPGLTNAMANIAAGRAIDDPIGAGTAANPANNKVIKTAPPPPAATTPPTTTPPAPTDQPPPPGPGTTGAKRRPGSVPKAGPYTRMANQYSGYVPNNGPLNLEYTSSGT